MLKTTLDYKTTSGQGTVEFETPEEAFEMICEGEGVAGRPYYDTARIRSWVDQDLVLDVTMVFR